MKFKNSNLRFVGTKMDVNGNSCYVFKYPNSRAFSIQSQNLGNVFSGWGFHLVKRPDQLFDRNYRFTPEDLEAAAIGYITVFGSKKQKEGLRIYKK